MFALCESAENGKYYYYVQESKSGTNHPLAVAVFKTKKEATNMAKLSNMFAQVASNFMFPELLRS